jgi:uncharacterized protein involved in exopolysaccharide biosynthesis
MQNEPPDYLQVLIRRRGWIGRIVGIALVVAMVVSLLIPARYESTASILPPIQESSFGAIFTNPSQIYAESGATTGGLVGEKSSSDLWIGMLNSRTIQERVIERLDLVRVFDVSSPWQVIKIFKKRVRIKKTKDDIVYITVEDTDPKRAADIGNAFIDALNALNERIVTTAAGRVRTFVEKRLSETRQRLADVEAETKHFQNQHRAVYLGEQSAAIIDAIGRVRGEVMSREVELSVLRSYATPNHPQVELLRTQIGELKRTLRKMEEDQKGPKSVYIPTVKLPDLSVEYARLLRDLKTEETLYDFLVRQYEQARIQEAKDSVSVRVLDVARPAEERSSPQRALIVLTSALAAAFLAVLASFFMGEVRKRDGEETSIQA